MQFVRRLHFASGAEESNAAWIYDAGTHALGKRVQEDNLIAGSAGVTRTFTYDNFGRPSTVTTTIGSSDFTASQTYDQVGRPFQVFDGAQSYSGLEYAYNAYGHLFKAIESRGSASLTRERYRITAKDARGHVTGLSKGGINVTRGFAPDTGRIQSIYAQTVLGATIQDFDYQFDALGNLTQKSDTRRGLYENYGYDGLNRLTSVSGSATLTMDYDGLGNIESKSDLGTYTYSTKPHAVATAGGVTYAYDGNGNLTSSTDGRTTTFSVFDKPTLISQSGNSVAIDYGPNRERFRRVESKGGTPTTTVYVGSFEYIQRPGGVTETKRDLDGEATVTTRSNGTEDVEYLFTDHLGSVDVITNDAGVIVQQMSFDAWGKLRNYTGTPNSSLQKLIELNKQMYPEGFVK